MRGSVFKGVEYQLFGIIIENRQKIAENANEYLSKKYQLLIQNLIGIIECHKQVEYQLVNFQFIIIPVKMLSV